MIERPLFSALSHVQAAEPEAVFPLKTEGYLVDTEGAAASQPATFWRALSADRRPSGSPGPMGPVSIATFGEAPDGELGSALLALGLQVEEDSDFLIALTDDYLQPGLDAVNVAALSSGRPWVICKPVGANPWIGPLFQPGKTGCWECLAARLRNNRPTLAAYLQSTTGGTAPFAVSQPPLPSTLQTALGIVATETARWLATGDSALEGVLTTLDPATLTSERHTLVRRPQCPVCGDPDYRTESRAVPVDLQSRRRASAGARSAPPEATLARYGHHVSRLTGVVNDLRRVSSDDAPVAVYVARSNASGIQGDASSPPAGPRALSVGKGFTDAQARVSALCEALERHSARFQGYEPRVHASYKALGQGAIHPNACMLFSGRQYDRRQVSNARGSRFQFVPEPFDPVRELDWALVWSLTRGAWRYLPAQYCYRDYPAESSLVFCRADSNGCAAGSNLEEAILHGFLELVERDCVAIWWYNRLRRPAVDLDSFGDPQIAELQRYYRSLGREFWVLDVTNDLAIPTFVAVSRRTQGAAEELVMGFGAHFDARIAVLHALAELTQFLGAAQIWSRLDEKELALIEPVALRWWRTATLAGQPYLAPDDAAPPRVAADYGVTGTDDLRDEIELCRRNVESHGMELLVLDQTRPDIELPVVKVIVPGLRHFWPRFGPGRLYDLPVKMRWLPKPTSEGGLNPIPLFL